MKRIILTLLVTLLGTAVLGAQDFEYYAGQFDSMTNLRDQLGVVRNAAEQDGPGAADFYVHALDALIRQYPNVQGATNSRYADDMARLLAQKLGEEAENLSEDARKSAGPNLWKTVESFSVSLVKADALTALGVIQATDYVPQVVQYLTDLNTAAPTEDRENQEIIAIGAIRALEEYKDSSGYLPVFFVITGWYNARVKDRAREALPKIMDNPTDPLVSVIKSSSYTYAVKLTALQTLEAANVTTQQKSQGAVASLIEAWRTSTNVVSQRSTLMQTRKLALSMIRRYGTEDTNVYPALERCYREGADEEEQIAAISALAALATDDSVQRLSSFLRDINTRLSRGTLTKEDERMVRVVIPALGNTGRPSARPALRSVLNLDWTGTVQRLAQDALKKIQ